jgi:hypothetical protein
VIRRVAALLQDIEARQARQVRNLEHDDDPRGVVFRRIRDRLEELEQDRLPLGFAILDEPRRPFAVLVEGLAGIVLGLGAFAVFSLKTWAWAAVTGPTPSPSRESCGEWWPSLPAVGLTHCSTTPTTG